jgi:hypothetical protein
MITRFLFYFWRQMPALSGSAIMFKKFIQPDFKRTSRTG